MDVLLFIAGPAYVRVTLEGEADSVGEVAVRTEDTSVTIRGARGPNLGPIDCPRIKGCGCREASDLSVIVCVEGGRVEAERLKGVRWMGDAVSEREPIVYGSVKGRCEWRLCSTWGSGGTREGDTATEGDDAFPCDSVDARMVGTRDKDG